MQSVGILAAAFAAAFFSPAVRAADPVRVVPTFEAAGLYWDAPGAPGDCAASFRRPDEAQWHRALDLWYDARADQCRGSLVNLAPGTSYEARLTSHGGSATTVSFATRAEQVPVARV